MFAIIDGYAAPSVQNEAVRLSPNAQKNNLKGSNKLPHSFIHQL